MDIVERLRRDAEKARQTWPEVFCVSEDLAERAADEIERLRAENKRLAKSRDKWGQRYNKTLEKLRLAVMRDTEYCKEIEADNERLREALRAIETISDCHENARQIARAALGEEK